MGVSKKSIFCSSPTTAFTSSSWSMARHQTHSVPSRLRVRPAL